AAGGGPRSTPRLRRYLSSCVLVIVAAPAEYVIQPNAGYSRYPEAPGPSRTSRRAPAAADAGLYPTGATGTRPTPAAPLSPSGLKAGGAGAEDNGCTPRSGGRSAGGPVRAPVSLDAGRGRGNSLAASSGFLGPAPSWETRLAGKRFTSPARPGNRSTGFGHRDGSDSEGQGVRVVACVGILALCLSLTGCQLFKLG